MKGLHWIKVPDSEITKTLWSKGVDDEGIRKILDIPELEEAFKVKAPSAASKSPSFGPKKKERGKKGEGEGEEERKKG